MRVEGLRVHPKLDEEVAREAGRLDPVSAWAGGTPLAGGRGMTRRISLVGRLFLLKKESRGGVAGRFLPDLYLFREPFEREWELSLWLGEQHLTPPLSARWYLNAGPAFQAWTLITPVEGAASLAELLMGGKAGASHLHAAGLCVGKFHRAQVIHGDLNAGNLLLTEKGCALIDLRHSYYLETPSEAQRYRNLSRLGRSLAKVRAKGGLLTRTNLQQMARGYEEGFGAGIDEAGQLLRSFGGVSLLRRWSWGPP